MHHSSEFILTIGGILLLGLITSTIAKRTPLPRVTLLLILGIFVGQEGLSLIPPIFTQHFELISTMTLLMVGFLLGGKLTRENLQTSGFLILSISIVAALMTAVIVTLGLMLTSLETSVAVLLGCIATATAPAAILDVINEQGKPSPFSKILIAVVALDDIWALLLFALGISMVKTLNGHGSEPSFLLITLRELGGALILGCAIGLPASYLTGRLKPGQPKLIEALCIVFICGGLAMTLEVSYLIAAVTMGAVVANLAYHHEYPFHAIEDVEPIMMTIFFVLAGASLEIAALYEIGWIGALYILLRSAGKILGGFLGCYLGRSPAATKRWMGPALLPQAGIAIGMGLVCSNQYPEYRQILLPIIIGSTVVFELIGPIFTKAAIKRTSAP